MLEVAEELNFGPYQEELAVVLAVGRGQKDDGYHRAFPLQGVACLFVPTRTVNLRVHVVEETVVVAIHLTMK